MLRYRLYPHRKNAPWLRAATVLLALAALVLWAAAPTPPAEAQPPPNPVVTFGYTGAAQTWTVPANVTRARFHVAGAQGGDMFNGQGGLGRFATARLAVTPGVTITIVVGGAGGNGRCSPQAPGGAGGFNGGGAGGSGGFCSGAGGGGASDVRIGGTTLAHRVIVGGGGGGGALNFCHGGDGGDPNGRQGGCDGGTGGDQSGQSGSGQLGLGSAGTDSNGDAFPGNGGGGGYYGGAGGQTVSNPRTAAGGGGGSSFGPARTLFEGRRVGDGVVHIIMTIPPTVTSISPTSGPEAGGTPVTITGTGFNTNPGGTSVAFGSNAATGVSCSSATTCTATSPPGSGTVNVTATTINGTSNGVPFTYVAPPPPPPPPPATPTMTSISPNSGPATGGTVVTIAGTGFSTTPGVTAVTFAGVLATSVSCASSTTCTASSPPGAGIVDVRVTVSGRTSPVSPASAFTYVPSPPPPPLVPLAQPMTLTVQVWRILPPLVSEAQIERTVVPVGRATVEARIGATLCSQGVTDSQGRVQLVVAADPPAQGCGQAGARVTFRVNDVVVLGEVRFVPDGSTEVVLRLPSPMYVIP